MLDFFKSVPKNSEHLDRNILMRATMSSSPSEGALGRISNPSSWVFLMTFVVFHVSDRVDRSKPG
jgi:hypothetical protein